MRDDGNLAMTANNLEFGSRRLLSSNGNRRVVQPGNLLALQNNHATDHGDAMPMCFHPCTIMNRPIVAFSRLAKSLHFF